MEIISEPTYIEEKFTRYDYGFIGDTFSFNIHENGQDTITTNGKSVSVELYTPRESLFINLANVLWVRQTSQTMRKLAPTPPLPTP